MSHKKHYKHYDENFPPFDEELAEEFPLQEKNDLPSWEVEQNMLLQPSPRPSIIDLGKETEALYYENLALKRECVRLRRIERDYKNRLDAQTKHSNSMFGQLFATLSYSNIDKMREDVKSGKLKLPGSDESVTENKSDS